MLKIGRSYFNESQIAAIQPSHAGDAVDVYLVRGAAISERIDEDELQEVLVKAELLAWGVGVDVLAFSSSENQELWLAYEDGYLFAAKDKSGQVYAYKEKPEKGNSEWIYTGEEAGTRRLHGDFECLSFEDDEPLELGALFSSGDYGEEDDEE